MHTSSSDISAWYTSQAGALPVHVECRRVCNCLCDSDGDEDADGPVIMVVVIHCFVHYKLVFPHGMRHISVTRKAC